MNRFSQLLHDLDQNTSTNHKVETLAAYFATVPAEDGVWALYLLTGRKLRRVLKRPQLFALIQKETGLKPWLFEECYSVVGDLAETCALLWPRQREDAGPTSDRTIESASLGQWMTERCPSLAPLSATAVEESLKLWWKGLSQHEIFVATKLITGGFRAGVAQGLVVKALAKAWDRPAPAITEALSGDWPVTAAFFLDLQTGAISHDSSLSPLPFYLASPLEGDPLSLGPIERYCLEWKWDGIRAQIVKKGDRVALWSRGEELITERFPELVQGAQEIKGDYVLDGEILAMRDDKVAPFADLQKRIGRKKLSPKMLAAIPVRYFAFDCLRRDDEDLRPEPLRVRRAICESLLTSHRLFALSPILNCRTWDEARELRQKSKERGVEGLMIKSWDGPYQMGRKRGDLWKWKVDPMTLDAVLIYAQAGHGRRATLYTDYTFALWKDGQLVPFAKAYSGLDDRAIRELDAWIRKHTVERFGPVRSVHPERVFEIAFEGMASSPRHKSGIAVRFPRILRERTDKTADQADSVETALALLIGCQSPEC